MTTRFAMDRLQGIARINSGGARLHGLDEFKESEHPRAKNGEFGQGSGSSEHAAAPAPAPAPAAAPASHSTPAAAPEPAATTFFSPNVGSGYNVSQGARRLHSAEQSKYRAVSDKVDSLMGLEAHSKNAVGAWSDGGENSIMTTYPAGTDYEAVKAACAMKGLLGQQKAVITFKSGEGNSRMHTISGIRATDPAKLSAALVAAGIPYHTLVKKERGYDVNVFEPEADDETDHNVATFAKHAKATAKASSGSGIFIGSDDSRAEGRKGYEEVISGYLGSHPEKKADWESMLASHKFRKAEDEQVW
jgi:hypothetical protein